MKESLVYPFIGKTILVNIYSHSDRLTRLILGFLRASRIFSFNFVSAANNGTWQRLNETSNVNPKQHNVNQHQEALSSSTSIMEPWNQVYETFNVTSKQQKGKENQALRSSQIHAQYRDFLMNKKNIQIFSTKKSNILYSFLMQESKMILEDLQRR